MTVYCWQDRDGHYCLSRSKPQVAAADDLWMHRQKGDVYGDMAAVCFVPPADLRPKLPEVNEVREMQFHVDLWGQAQELPSYNKRLWADLQNKLMCHE